MSSIAQRTSHKTPPCGSAGDVNGDGYVTMEDAVIAGKASRGEVYLDDAAMSRADVDGDGEVTAYDAGLISGYVRGTVSSFPVCSLVTARRVVVTVHPEHNFVSDTDPGEVKFRAKDGTVTSLETGFNDETGNRLYAVTIANEGKLELSAVPGKGWYFNSWAFPGRSVDEPKVFFTVRADTIVDVYFSTTPNPPKPEAVSSPGPKASDWKLAAYIGGGIAALFIALKIRKMNKPKHRENPRPQSYYPPQSQWYYRRRW